MEAERRNPKGGFFQLFDWNSKSRKKLFSNKSELLDTDSSKQGKQNVAKSFSHPQLLEVRENGHGLTGKRNDDCIPSSVATDDRYGTKAPGVVARLMGLDCLPTSAAPEPAANPFCDQSFSLNSCSQRHNPNLHTDYHYVNNIPHDRGPRNLVDPRLQKMQSRPIERFQSEMLPHKSAKHIPTSHHHRLLSPIKNPSFRPTNDFAFIVEASSKIIDQCPRSEAKGKKLHFVSSSVPLKIRDVRERMEAVPRAFGRPKENVVSQCNRGQSRDKNHSRLIDTQTNYTPMKNRRKPVSLAAQAKVNVQRKEGFSSSDSRSANRKKADDVAKSSQRNQGQMTMQRNGQKRNNLSRLSSVHELKNQKQNCASTREKLPPRGASAPSQQNRKSPLVSGSVRPVKAVGKVMNSGAGSEKINTMAKDTGKEIKLSQSNTFPEKKQPGHENMYLEDNVEDHSRQIKCKITDDGCSSWDAGERQSSIDIVSFTFTSPIKKPYTVSESSEHLIDNGILHNDNINYSPETPTLYSPRSNVTGGDALSFLLEQKLKELTSRAESSDCRFGNDASASSNSDVMDTTPNRQCIGFELNLRKAKPSVYDVDSSSSDGLMRKAYGRWQGLQEIEGQSSVNSNRNYGKELNLRYASLMSTIEPSSSDASSSDLNSISITKGKNKQFHIMNNHEMTDCISNGVSQSSEVDLEFSDSASSSSVAYISGSCDSPSFSLVEYQRSTNWELEYIMRVLCNSNMVLDDLVLGQVNKVLNHTLFDHLENLQTGSAENTEDYFKLERKVLFDFIVEWLDSRGEQILGGYCQQMMKWGTLLRKKEVLGEDLYKEMSSWTSIGELMVDELVDKDMSFGKGKWVDFETEEFEEGVEIEKEILSSLVDEMVVDFLILDQTVSILG